MKYEFSKDFQKQLEKAKNNPQLIKAVRKTVLQVQQAHELSDIPHLKPLVGFPSYYRIRVAEYRIGIAYKSSKVLFLFAGHRKDVYKKHLP